MRESSFKLEVIDEKVYKREMKAREGGQREQVNR